jgi:hypothetical protein
MLSEKSEFHKEQLKEARKDGPLLVVCVYLVHDEVPQEGQVHGHGVVGIFDIPFPQGFEYLPVVVDGVALTLGIHGDLDILGHGGIEDIGEVAYDPIAAGFSYQTMETAVCGGVGTALLYAMFHFLGLSCDFCQLGFRGVGSS